MKGCSSVIHVRLPDALIEKAKKRSQDVGMSEWVRGLIINALGDGRGTGADYFKTSTGLRVITRANEHAP